MANDYQGAAKDFALVVPVPVVLKPEQVKIGEAKVIQQLDAFSAPRLVEYFDPDPCNPYPIDPSTMSGGTRGGSDITGTKTRIRIQFRSYY